MVMWRNLTIAPPPSISTASYNSFGMDCIAAVTMTMTYGNDHQAVTAMTSGSAKPGSPSISPGSNPAICMMYGMGPNDGLSSQSQMLPTTDMDSVQGKRISTRRADPVSPALFSTRAAAAPRIVAPASDPTT